MTDVLNDTQHPGPDERPSAIPEPLDAALSRYRVAQLIDSIDHPIILVDRNLAISSFNEAAAKALLLTKLEIGKPARGIRIFTNTPELEERFSSAIEAGESYQREIRDETGSWFILRISPFKGNDQVTLAVLTLTNVTALRASLEQAVYEREHTKAIINNLIDPVVILDDQHRIQTANQSFFTMFQVTRDQAQGVRLYDLGSDYWNTSQLVRFLEQICNKTSDSLDCVLQLPLAGRRNVALNARRLSREGGRGILLTLHDVTDRKQREDALERKEQELTDFFDNASIGIHWVNEDGIILRANRAELEFLGYEQNEYVGRNISEFYVDKQHIADILMQLKQGEVIRECEAQMRCKNGSIKHVLIDSNVFWEGDRFIHTRCLTRDITEQKKADEARSRLAAIVNSSDDAIVGKTLEGIITSWNPGAEKIFGYSAAEAIGRHISLIIPEDRRFEENRIINRIRRGQSVEHYETVRLTKDGQRIHISLTISPIRNSEGRIIGASKVARDITQMKRMEEEMFQANKMESVGVLAGGIAHDFNNILTAIIGNLSLSKIYLDPGHKAFQNIDESQKAALSARGITQQLITFSQGGTPVKKTVLIGPQIGDWVKFSLQGSNVAHELLIEDDLWPVDVDEGQIHQAINNIILNAQQAMPDGGLIQIRVSNFVNNAKLLPLRPGQYIRIQVKDHGIGISQEKLSKVFDPFFTTKPNGTGLGLTSSYWVTKRHEGHISIDSEPGKGTTVTMYLPMSTEKPILKKLKKEILIPGRGRILFMDDDVSIRKLAFQLLTHLGYEIECAEDGLEAIELFRKARESGHPFDVVILDLTVRDGMGGGEAVRKLLKIDPRVKTVVSSGYSNDPMLANYEKYGFVGMIPKPYTGEKLSSVLSDVMGLKTSL